MKVVIFETQEYEKALARRILKGHKLQFINKTVQKTKKGRDADVVSCFTGSKFNEKVLKQFPKLKHIATRTTGYDHIDLDYCKKNKITISTSPTYGERTVAEHTFALLMAISRKICECISRGKKGKFTHECLEGFDLFGKTIGIIGTGNIGENSARIAKGFGMNILLYDIKKDKKFAKEIKAKYVSFDDLLKKSDIITLHVPLVKGTHHLINKTAVRKMKKGVILLNTSRGEIIDTCALYDGLNSGKIGAVGLDVLEEELYFKGCATDCDKKIVGLCKKILKMDNAYVTPHNAFNTKEASERRSTEAFENIKAFTKNRKKNLVKL